MAAGRILNRALLARLSSALGIEGVKQFPATLDLTDIKATLNLNNELMAVPPAAPVFTTKANNSGNFPANTLDVGVNLIGAAAAASFNPATTGGNVVADSTLESRVLSISCNVSYTAAGAAADNAAGVLLSALIVLRSPAGELSFAVQDVFAGVVNVSPYGFNWTFPQGLSSPKGSAGYTTFKAGSKWDGFIPPGYSCWLQMTRGSGVGFFPALVSMDTYFCVAQRRSRGDWKA